MFEDQRAVMEENTGGMAIAGAGAGINELTALAATAEMAPTKKRGQYVAFLIFSILPFCPSVLWAQLIAAVGDMWVLCVRLGMKLA